MTIGIAAFGPNAGSAVLAALGVVEKVGRGAIGGFVSLVAITPSGALLRAETQEGGSLALFGGDGVPAEIRDARIAGLMSSGPHRPEPLRQFTPADAGIGLVTGHRMPNTLGRSGMNLNDEVLDLMRSGVPTAEAVERVVWANPDVDAGILALSAYGDIHAANTAHVKKRRDTGQVVLRSRETAMVVGVIHNAIRPHGPIAALAAEVALDVMRPTDRPDGWITFNRGARLVAGANSSVEIDAEGFVETIVVDRPTLLNGTWSLGIGFETPITKAAQPIAAMIYEPYMVVCDGYLQSIDGRLTLSVPMRLI